MPKRRKVEVDVEITWLVRILEVTVSAFIIGTAIFAFLYILASANTSEVLRF